MKIGFSLVRALLLAAVGALVAGSVGGSASSSATSIPVISDAQLHAITSTMGGAPALSSSDTIAHWAGSSVNPDNGVTYGYNMVGSNPFTCSGAACSTTVEVDITPVIVNIDGMTFSGVDSLGALGASP